MGLWDQKPEGRRLLVFSPLRTPGRNYERRSVGQYMRSYTDARRHHGHGANALPLSMLRRRRRSIARAVSQTHSQGALLSLPVISVHPHLTHCRSTRRRRFAARYLQLQCLETLRRVVDVSSSSTPRRRVWTRAAQRDSVFRIIRNRPVLSFSFFPRALFHPNSYTISTSDSSSLRNWISPPTWLLLPVLVPTERKGMVGVRGCNVRGTRQRETKEIPIVVNINVHPPPLSSNPMRWWRLVPARVFLALQCPSTLVLFARCPAHKPAKQEIRGGLEFPWVRSLIEMSCIGVDARVQ